MDKPSKLYRFIINIVIHPCLDFIRGLLENVGTDIEPLRLIKRIPDNLEIPGLKESLLKILQDYNLQMHYHQQPVLCIMDIPYFEKISIMQID